MQSFDEVLDERDELRAKLNRLQDKERRRFAAMVMQGMTAGICSLQVIPGSPAHTAMSGIWASVPNLSVRLADLLVAELDKPARSPCIPTEGEQ